MNKQQIISIISATYPFLKPEEVKALLTLGEYCKLGNKQVIIGQGDRSKRAFFILKGMVRGYMINHKGEEKNLFLRPEHTITGAPDSMFEDIATKYTFETIQETHLLIFPFTNIETLSTQHISIARVYIEALKENMQTLLFRVESLVNMTPEERYEALFARSPELFQTAFNKHIANYLGITPVSLSRIIKRNQHAQKQLDN